MRTSNITREQALALLREYNKEGFHIQHGLTVEGVMCWYANELGYAVTKSRSIRWKRSFSRRTSLPD